METYLASNIFLPKINNEIEAGIDLNQTFIKNIRKLNKFVMVMFSEDTMITPKTAAVSSHKFQTFSSLSPAHPL
jgi:hypothetical protein